MSRSEKPQRHETGARPPLAAGCMLMARLPPQSSVLSQRGALRNKSRNDGCVEFAKKIEQLNAWRKWEGGSGVDNGESEEPARGEREG